MIQLFDLHCDTLLNMYKSQQSITDNSLHISLKNAHNFEPYMQIASVWSDYRLNNNRAFENFINVHNYASTQKIKFTTNISDFSSPKFILGIEDARLLNSDINRLYVLYTKGARVLTLNWKGVSCIGGRWDTDISLTPFGTNVVRTCSDLKIIIDLSHSSSQVFWEVIRLSQHYNFIPIASHSNAFSVCNHKRNLSDEQFKELSKINSLVGISLASEHLGDTPTIDSVLMHIDHYLSLNGESNIALGCDFDGVSSLPKGITSIKDLSLLFYNVEKSFGKLIAEKIFFYNAYNFFKKQLC